MQRINAMSYNVQVLVNLGMEICATIKNIYFKNDTWTITVTKEINKLFGIIKNKAKIFHPDLGEEDLLKMIRKYSNEDIVDCLDDYLKKRIMN